MSADLLREAAETMRANWESEWDCDPAEAEFYVAVADWLDATTQHQPMGCDWPECDCNVSQCLICGHDWPCREAIPALAVARAYLGRDS